MRQLEASIRTFHLDRVKASLTRLGVTRMTIAEAEPPKAGARGAAAFLPKIKVQVIVSDEVDLTRQATVAGTYSGVATMGFFWSPSPVTDEPPAAPDSVMQPQIVRLDAQASGVSPAQVTLERRWAGPGVTRHEMTRRFTIWPGRLTGPRSTKSRSRIPTVGRSSAGTGSWIAISVIRPFRISFARSDDGGIAGLVINPGTWPIPATRVS
jgi:hypothetical protein